MNVVGDAVDDLDWNVQLFPNDVDAFDNALAEGVVDVKNDRRLRLHAGRRAQILNANDRVTNQRRRRRKVAEDLREALFGNLRRRGDIDQEGTVGCFGRLCDRNRAAGIVRADEQCATVADQALGDDAAVFRLLPDLASP